MGGVGCEVVTLVFDVRLGVVEEIRLVFLEFHSLTESSLLLGVSHGTDLGFDVFVVVWQRVTRV